MSIFDLEASKQRAERRLKGHTLNKTARRGRSDRGRSRLDAQIQRRLDQLLSGQDKPPMRDILCDIRCFCEESGLKSPSRATVYAYLIQTRGNEYRLSDLPSEVRSCLYNLRDDATLPGRQLAFYCFNYGDSRAAAFAAGLPWLDLYQAARTQGWRRRSRGLLQAVLRVRNISSPRMRP